MKTEKVIDVVFKYFPNKLMIYLRDKLLFNDNTEQLLKYYDYLENLNVYTYEYINKEKNMMLIRVIEV